MKSEPKPAMGHVAIVPPGLTFNPAPQRDREGRVMMRHEYHVQINYWDVLTIWLHTYEEERYGQATFQVRRAQYKSGDSTLEENYRSLTLNMEWVDGKWMLCWPAAKYAVHEKYEPIAVIDHAYYPAMISFIREGYTRLADLGLIGTKDFKDFTYFHSARIEYEQDLADKKELEDYLDNRK